MCSLLPSDTSAKLKHSLQPEEVEIWTAARFWGTCLCITLLLLVMAFSCVEIILRSVLAGRWKLPGELASGAGGGCVLLHAPSSWSTTPCPDCFCWLPPLPGVICISSGCSGKALSMPASLVRAARSCRGSAFFLRFPWLQEPLLQLLQVFCSRTCLWCCCHCYCCILCWVTNVS